MVLLDQLQALPDEWGLVAVGDNKRPYQHEWQKHPLTKAEVAAEINAGRAKAVGVIAGPASGGLLFVDHDGVSASEVLDRIGAPLRTLPKSWAMTSGRNGRFQVIYRVPERYWDHLHTKRIKSGKQDEEGNNEQLELRWTGCQSVVIGAHPSTQGYRWLKGRAPHELPIAEAPTALIEQMLRLRPQQDAAPLLAPPTGGLSDSERARQYLAALSSARADDYDTWLQVGMALHSVGDDSLLADWEAFSRASAKNKPQDCEQKWRSFSAGTSGITLGTLGQLAKQDGWQPPSKSKSKPAPAPPSAPRASTLHGTVEPADNETASIKPQKLEAIELLQRLRASSESIRYNVFTQQIEIKGEVMQGAERFYLQLAEMGYKVSKELAMDCLVQVANEHPYDPVRLYLEHVAETVQPAYIDALATTYLRPGDAPGSLYDEMLKRTLIAAVKRIFEPGCKHDTACVLMGDQGARKSTFWNVLGGTWFSDALRDITSKDDLMVLHRSWLMEWAELDHITSKKHAGQVKAFLSQATDLFRVPYGKATEAFPRRCVIVGSTNRSTGFLVDETGNRRFWVIPTTKTIDDPIDIPGLLLERDAIWAAAVQAYRAGETSFLNSAREQEVANENQDYLVTNPWQPAIEGWLARQFPGDPITTEAILTDAVAKPIERQTKHDQMQVADILKRLGYDRRRAMVTGQRQWRWFKVA
jgi:predicted P-loop ATPase